MPLLLTITSAFAIMLYGSLKKSPKEKRREMLKDFDEAMKKAQDDKNPSTKELEKWLSKNL